MITEAISQLKQGKVIACPTDTVYGLFVLEEFQDELYKLKGRDKSQACQILCSSEEKEVAQKFLQKFHGQIMFLATSTKNGSKIGVRMVKHSIATQLIEAVGGYVTASSSNPKGLEPAKNIKEIKEYFPNIYALEGEIGGINSTILDLTNMKIIREGAVRKLDILSI